MGSLRNNNILCVDSDTIFSEELVSSCLKQKYNIYWAKNQKDARFKFEYYSPQVIIADLLVEHRSTLKLLEEFKQKNKSVKIIIITNDFRKESLLKGIDLSVLSYLEKAQSSIPKIFDLLQKNRIFKKNAPSNEFKLGDGFVYSKELKELFDKFGESIKINNQERLVIESLLKNTNNYVPYSRILNELSRTKSVSLYTLRTIVRHIRKKTYKNIIENLSGHGYKISIEKSDIEYKSQINEKKIKNNRVLLIEDDIELNANLQRQLINLGFSCDEVYTYKQTLQKLADKEYDYILLDLHLADKEGLDLIKSVKSMTKTKIIVLTESLDVHLKESLYFLGILDYIEKNKSIKYLSYTIYRTIINIEYNNSLNEILVLDSSSYMCDNIDKLLKPRGYELTYKYKVENALALLEKKKFDLMILDLDLLGDKLFQTLSFIKEIYKELPIIVLSSIKKSSTIRDCLKMGASEIILKPLLAEEFILKVDFWVDYNRKVYQLKQNQLLLSEYKLIVDKASIVSKTDKNGIITYVNDTFCHISGYDKSELIGKRHNIIKHPDMPSEVFDELWDCIKKRKEIWHGRIKNRRKDGSPYFVDSYIMPILDTNGEIIEFIALRNFISEKEFNASMKKLIDNEK